MVTNKFGAGCRGGGSLDTRSIKKANDKCAQRRTLVWGRLTPSKFARETPLQNCLRKKNILRYAKKLRFCGQCVLRKLAPFSWFEILWAKSGVFADQNSRGVERKKWSVRGHIVGKTTKNGNNENVSGGNKETCIIDFAEEKGGRKKAFRSVYLSIFRRGLELKTLKSD